MVRGLWDSWEDDAVVRDYASGRFLDRDKLHYVDFEGEAFTVKGPAIVPRPPQGQLVVFGGEDDREQVDVVLVAEPDRDAAVETARSSCRPGVRRNRRLAGHTARVRRWTASPRSTVTSRPAASPRLQYAGAATGFVELLTRARRPRRRGAIVPHGDRRGPSRARPLRPVPPSSSRGWRIDRYPGRRYGATSAWVGLPTATRGSR